MNGKNPTDLVETKFQIKVLGMSILTADVSSTVDLAQIKAEWSVIADNTILQTIFRLVITVQSVVEN